MVNASKLKPGDKVKFNLSILGKSVVVDGSRTTSGLSESVSYGDVFTVADPPIPWGSQYMVNLEWLPGKNGILECSEQYLDQVVTADPVDAVHDMRNAGPPKPASCICDIMALMRIGCRCGYTERES